MGRLLVMFMVAYAVLVTVQVLWSGPYLHDVHGLDTLERGHVLLGMAVAQTVGTLLVGPMDRVLNTSKWVVVAAASLTLASLTVLAVVPVSLPVAVGLLLVLSGSSTYGSVLYAQVRGLFPDHLAGRSATITNMAPLLGASVLPTLTGFIPPLFPSQGRGLFAARLPEHLRDAGGLPRGGACDLHDGAGREAAAERADGGAGLAVGGLIFSRMCGASGLRLSESCCAATTLREEEMLPDDRGKHSSADRSTASNGRRHRAIAHRHST